MRLRLQSESVTSDRWVHANETNLPPPSYTKLFGRNQPISRLVEQLLKMGPPWITAIVGIGGIGKTAVADAVIRQVIRDFRFERVVWLRVDPYPAKAPTLTFEATLAKLAEFLSPQLPKNISPSEEIAHVQSILKANSHLVVIDNVEREADAANLLERLKDLASPSKFLLTSRTHLLGQADVFVTSLDELSPKDALDLLRHQASTIGLGDLANIDKTGMAPIYEVVGGNPLAIKIVVGLAVAQPLSQILVELRSNRPRDIENLYLQIFWKAWQALTPHARALLQAMPLVVEPGALPAQMQAISKLPEAQFWAAITELVTWSLLEVRGTAQERRYGIHRLTETFLRTEIIRSH